MITVVGCGAVEVGARTVEMSEFGGGVAEFWRGRVGGTGKRCVFSLCKRTSIGIEL
jgi:hypothetical protein